MTGTSTSSVRVEGPDRYILFVHDLGEVVGIRELCFRKGVQRLDGYTLGDTASLRCGSPVAVRCA